MLDVWTPNNLSVISNDDMLDEGDVFCSELYEDQKKIL
jgi:hypothetical protein